MKPDLAVRSPPCALLLLPLPSQRGLALNESQVSHDCKLIVVMRLFQLIGLALVPRLYQEHRTQLLSVCVAIG